ncbi:ANK_REP_REGION domain-containing protein [Caenorhabditis elegans]|uniref:ANK_REP_REGION domain-containing protein n=1 Tax=Caenorhabditis elegans TaxID=6239 RepID=O16632_CAEEL|nr:ANK_REP_REGION domain-containing protein [Caenorhabditis elegans]CCD70874.1 ANK_REP_REGION domain-containing protein [Caenorhabditis elegans]|eukprot:NP_494293.1 Uncharacterized protein CELE_K02F6.4 [Caenorhabditis elegans]
MHQAQTKLFRKFSQNHSPPPPRRSSALHDAIDKLSIVARVTNAITIQKGLNDKSMKMANLLDELLNIPPGDGFSNLQTLDLKKAKEGYIGIAKDAGALTKSSLDGAKNAQRLKHLGDMGKNVEMLKKAEAADLTDAIGKVTGSFDISTSLITTSLKPVSEHLNLLLKNKWTPDTDQRAKECINSLKSSLGSLGSTLREASKYEDSLKLLWSVINISQSFDVVERLGVVAKTYHNQFNEIRQLSKDFKNTKEEFTKLDSFFKQFSLLRLLKDSISKSLKIRSTTPSNSTKPRLLTSGFLNGLGNVQAVKKDLNNEWFLKKIARNDKSSLIVLKQYLRFFETVSSKSVEMETVFTPLRTISAKPIETSETLLNSAVEVYVNPTQLQTFQKSILEVGECIDKLGQMTANVNFETFQKTIQNLKSFDTSASKTRSLLKKIVELNVLGDRSVFDQLRTDINNINTSLPIGEYFSNIITMRANKNYLKIVEGVATVYEYFEEIGQLHIDIVITNLNTSLPIITQMQPVLKGTNLVDTLECLKNKNFNSSLASDVLKFGSNIRAFGVHAKNDKATISFLDLISKLQNLYFSVKKSLDGKRTRRATGSIDPTKLPNLLASQDLGKGLQLLRQLSEVNNKKKIVTDVTKFSDSVFAEVQKILKTVDTSTLKPELKKMLLDLTNLESFASNHTGQGLRELGAIFEKASEVSGVTVNSSLLEDPVAKTLSTSAVNDIKKAAPSFKTLGSLELNYANHRSTFKGASLCIVKIDEFFSDFFAAGGNVESSSGTLYVGVVGGIALLIGAGVGGFLLWKHLDMLKLLKNPVNYRHSAFTIPEGEMRYDEISETNRHLSIHSAISDRNFERFKNCVDNSADVNAYSCHSNYYSTPLHMAVTRNLVQFVAYLLKNGADPSKMDSNYQLPAKLAEKTEKKEELLAMFNKYSRGKKTHRKLPKFGPSDYKVWIHYNDMMAEAGEADTDVKEAFVKMFPKNMVTDAREATHIILPTDEKGVLSFDVRGDKEMFPYIFRETVLMKNSWMTACLKDKKNFADDYKFQVEGVEMKSETFNTVRLIHQHAQQYQIPYLAGVTMYYHQFPETPDTTFENLVRDLGADVRQDLRYLDRQNTVTASPYYRDDIGPVFIITKSKDELVKEYAFVKNNNCYTIFTYYEFLQFLLAFKITHWKLTGKKEPNCIEKWDELKQSK